jgi:hypothetical protein
MTEDRIINCLNEVGFNFVKMDDKFSRYDAFDSEGYTMMEIKCRHKHYPDTIIEKIKFDWNKEHAEKNDLEFLYVVSMPCPIKKKEVIYVFDPLVMEAEDDYNFKWHTKRLPAKTEFAGRQWVDKEIGYLNIKDALVTVEEKVHQ